MKKHFEYIIETDSLRMELDSMRKNKEDKIIEIAISIDESKPVISMDEYVTLMNESVVLYSIESTNNGSRVKLLRKVNGLGYKQLENCNWENSDYVFADILSKVSVDMTMINSEYYDDNIKKILEKYNVPCFFIDFYKIMFSERLSFIEGFHKFWEKHYRKTFYIRGKLVLEIVEKGISSSCYYYPYAKRGTIEPLAYYYYHDLLCDDKLIDELNEHSFYLLNCKEKNSNV